MEKTADVQIYDSNADVTDDRFRSLRQLPRLKSIGLEYCGCVDAFLENIQGMASLEELTLHRAGVSRKGRFAGSPVFPTSSGSRWTKTPDLG